MASAFRRTYGFSNTAATAIRAIAPSVIVGRRHQHGFNNDTTPRYDAAAAKLAWERTIAHFNKYVRG